VVGCNRWLDHTLLYVGISPTTPPSNGKPSSQSLRTRLRYHYRGNAHGSTLRLSLGCLLGLTLRSVGRSDRMTFADDEEALSEWMAINAAVAWIVYPRPWELESDLIRAVTLPLNLDQNEGSAFHAHLTELRRSARQKARGMAIQKSSNSM
jgi:hypothetical protein